MDVSNKTIKHWLKSKTIFFTLVLDLLALVQIYLPYIPLDPTVMGVVLLTVSQATKILRFATNTAIGKDDK